jgi:hypothetical protein
MFWLGVSANCISGFCDIANPPFLELNEEYTTFAIREIASDGCTWLLTWQFNEKSGPMAQLLQGF